MHVQDQLEKSILLYPELPVGGNVSCSGVPSKIITQTHTHQHTHTHTHTQNTGTHRHTVVLCIMDAMTLMHTAWHTRTDTIQHTHMHTHTHTHTHWHNVASCMQWRLCTRHVAYVIMNTYPHSHKVRNRQVDRQGLRNTTHFLCKLTWLLQKL